MLAVEIWFGMAADSWQKLRCILCWTRTIDFLAGAELIHMYIVRQFCEFLLFTSSLLQNSVGRGASHVYSTFEGDCLLGFWILIVPLKRR